MGESRIKNNLKYYPLLSERDSLGQELASGEFNNLWSAFDALSEPVKNIIASPEVPKRIEMFQKKHGLSDDHIEIISTIIREFILLERDENWLKSVLEKNFEPSLVSIIQTFIVRNILTIKPEPVKQPEEEKPKTVQLPLLDAMGTYPKIGEQVVTSDRITIRGESGPVRGTVRNWLRAYRDALGVRKHTSMERGQFLFQGENTRRLPKDERMRLSTLLKSLDDKTPLDINVERREIQFPNTEAESGSMPTETHSAPPASRPALSTTPQQKLQAFRPVGDRLRIASARSQQESIPSATNTPEETAQQGEELSSAVYGDIVSAPASEENGFRFSASHILPHERASKLGIERYRTPSEPPEPTPQNPPKNTASVGTDTFSPETAPSPKTEKQATSPASRKNFGNLVNLRDS